jgi:hypothetical protein
MEKEMRMSTRKQALACAAAGLAFALALSGCQRYERFDERGSAYGFGRTDPVAVTISFDDGEIGAVSASGGQETWLHVHVPAGSANPSQGHLFFAESVRRRGNLIGFRADAHAGATMTLWGLMSAGQAAANAAGFDTGWPRIFSGSATIGGVDELDNVDNFHVRITVHVLVERDGTMSAWPTANPPAGRPFENRVGYVINRVSSAISDDDDSYNYNSAIGVFLSGAPLQRAMANSFDYDGIFTGLDWTADGVTISTAGTLRADIAAAFRAAGNQALRAAAAAPR